MTIISSQSTVISEDYICLVRFWREIVDPGAAMTRVSSIMVSNYAVALLQIQQKEIVLCDGQQPSFYSRIFLPSGALQVKNS
jgi:hypothetical protein